MKYIIVLFSFIVIFQSCDKVVSCADGEKNGNETEIDCGGSCTKCLSSEKKIIDIIFQDAPSGFNPIINIDNNKFRVELLIPKAFPTTDLSNLAFELNISDGAIIENLIKDYRNPTIITIKAEDGSTQDYLIIVSQAYGSHTVLKNGTSSTNEIRGIYQNILTSSGGGNIRINFSSNIDIKPSEFYYVVFDLKNKSFSNNLVGQYDLKTINNLSHNCEFAFPTATGGIKGLLTPLKGILHITKHDMINKLISGSTTDLFYKNTTGSDEYYPYIEFTNIQYEE